MPEIEKAFSELEKNIKCQFELENQLIIQHEVLLISHKQLLKALIAGVKVMDIKHILSSCPTKSCVICKAVEEMKDAIDAAIDDG